MLIGILLIGASPRRGDGQQPSARPTAVPISAWAARAGLVIVARHPSFEDFFDSTAALFNPPSGSLETRDLATAGVRTLADSLDRVSGIAIRDRGDQAAIAMLHRQRVTMHFRQGYVGGLRLIDLVTGRDVTPARMRSDESPADQPVYARDGKSIVVARYRELPSRRHCAYVACGEDEFTRFDIWLHRVDVTTGADAKLVRLGRDDMEDSAPQFLISPAGDRVLVWSNTPSTEGVTSHMRPGTPRMIDVATAKPIPGFRRDALAMSGARLSVSCAPDSMASGFIEFSPNGRLLARGTERAVKLVDARTGARIAERVLSDAPERFGPQGDSTQIVILNGHVNDDSTLVLTTCRPGVPGTRVVWTNMFSGARRALYVTLDLLLDARLVGQTLVARSEVEVWSINVDAR